MNGTHATPDAAPGRWRMLALLAVAELLGMSLWFAATAVAPQLREQWSLTASQGGWLTTIVQLGFVAGTACAAVLNLADLIPARFYFAAASLLAALSNAALLISPSFEGALVSRFLTGFFLAGVYPPGMKMVATWFQKMRGLAIGTLVGALVVGSATPYVVKAIRGSEGASVAPVMLAVSVAGVIASLLVLFGYRDGPFPFARRKFSWGLIATVLKHGETRRAINGYLGHMWELYAMWAWLPVFLAAASAARIAAGHAAPSARDIDLIIFGVFLSGGLGCLWAGWASARIGYARVVNIAMAMSGLCCLVVGLLFEASPLLLAPLVWVWGFFVVADSAQFSAMVTEAAPPHAVGTALTLQTSMGFLLTMLTIQWVPMLAEAQGWQWAFPILALGPLFGIAAISRFGKSTSPAPQ